MPIAKGYSTVKAAYRESAWGVTATPLDAYGVNAQTIESSVSQNMIEDPTMLSGRGFPSMLYGNIDTSVTINTTMNPEQSGFWLAMALGLPVTTGSTAPYSHLFAPKALPSFTLETDFRTDIASTVLQYLGCKVSSAAIQANQEGPVTLNLTCSAQKVSKASTPLDATPVYPGHRPWGSRALRLRLDTVSACDVMSLSLNIDNELDTSIYTIPCTGQTYGQRGELPEGRARITGSMDLMLSTVAMGLFDKAVADGEAAIAFDLVSGAGDGAAVGGEKLAIQLPHAQIGKFAPPVNTRSGLRVTVPFSCYTGTNGLFYAMLLSPRTATQLYVQALT